MGSKKELEKQGQSSKRRHEKDLFSDGERSRARKNAYALKNNEKEVKRKMQRLLDGELDGLEDDDLYGDSYVSFKRKGMSAKNHHNGESVRLQEMEG